MGEVVAPLRGRRALIAGLGNIGSTLPALLARAGIGRLILIDRDTVEARNLAAQDYRPEDIGRPKAEAVARRLREQFAGVEVEAHAIDIGLARRDLAEVDIVLGALDSRLARQALVSEVAWPAVVPVVDGGVGDPLLGRVQVFIPGAETGCLECTWGEADYRLASAEYPCRPGEAPRGAPTGAPAHLGALVAALMASEAVRVLTGEGEKESYEIALNLTAAHMRRFALRRNARCRYAHPPTRRTP